MPKNHRSFLDYGEALILLTCKLDFSACLKVLKGHAEKPLFYCNFAILAANFSDLLAVSVPDTASSAFKVFAQNGKISLRKFVFQHVLRFSKYPIRFANFIAKRYFTDANVLSALCQCLRLKRS